MVSLFTKEHNGILKTGILTAASESCEMWLHGHCLNITKRTMPSVYICRFCANTANFGGNQMQEDSRHNALGIATAVSPLANKSFRSFR